MEVVVLIIVVLSSIVLGLFVFNTNPKSVTNRIFLLLSSSIAIWSLILHLSLDVSSVKMTLFFVRLSTTFAVPLAGSFLLLVHTFPRDRLRMSKREFYGLIIILTSTMLFTFSPYVFTSIEPSSTSFAPVVGPGMIVFAVVVNGAAILSVILLIQRFIKSVGKEKSQIGYLLLGFILMIGLIIVTIFLPVAFFKNINFVSYGPLYTLLFLLATAYAIVRHRFLDIRLIVARSVAFSLLLLIIIASYSITLFGISIFITNTIIQPVNLAIAIVSTIVVAFSFQPLKRLLEKITSSIFYKDAYNVNDLLENMSRLMSSTIDLEKLSERFLHKLFEEMKVEKSAVVLVHGQKITHFQTFGIDEKEIRNNQYLPGLIEHVFHKHQEKILIFDEMEESKEKNMLRKHGIYIILPIAVKRELLGGLIFGEKASGETYTSEDINVLKILSSELGIAVRNALSYQELKEFNIRLKEEVERATIRLRHANIRLKELDLLKDEFVSLASHELRTPMTAIKSYLWMALNKSPVKLDPTLQKYLDISYQSTERLITLVNEMLTISRIERKKVELQIKPFNLYDTINQVQEELKIKAEEKKISLILESSQKRVLIEGDKDKLREVLQNIVGNALKFTPEGGRISIKLATENQVVKIAVSDTGPGIPKEERHRLFEKFSRIEHSYANQGNIQGTGLGLYVSKQIAALHHGDISVESEVNVGSTFTVTLPIKQPKAGEHK